MISLDLTIDSYLASRRLSHHKLRTFAELGPRGYFMAIEQHKWTQADTAHFLSGRAMEDALQRPDEYAARYAQKPDGMNFGSKEGRVWRAIVEHKLPSLSADDAMLAQALQDAWGGAEQFAARWATKPDDMNFARAEGKAWKIAQEAAGKKILTAADASTVERLMKLLPAQPKEPREVLDGEDATAIAALAQTIDVCPIAQSLIQAAQMQVTVLHDDVSDCWNVPGIQCRPDWLGLDGSAATNWRPYALDLKSTDKLSRISSGRSILKYGYHRQAAMVRMCLEREGVDIDGFKYLLLGAEKTFPYRWQVVEVPLALIDKGQAWCERQLARLSDHYATGDWPLVMSSITVADVPAWADDEAA